ncbi:MAG: alpha/beta fold hydrolase [Candidatus Hydrogenedens sp.]|nr:alpha/beta fold hydrolase [Candidatus Hydrogenedens sp.]
MRKKFAIFGIVLLVIILVPLGALGAFYQSNFARTPGQYFDSDGVQIYYTDQGEGEPVILVHGFAFNADLNWRSPGIIDALAKDYRVIALDNRGHGLSGKPHDPAAYGEEMPRDIIRLMDHLGIEKANVIGYSMGGFITLKLATMYPERLISAAPCGMGWGKMDDDNRALIDRIASSLEEGKGFGPLLERLNIKVEDRAVSGKLFNYMLTSTNDTLALAAAMRGMEQLEVSEEALRKNQVPMLTVVGSIDPLAEEAGPMEKVANSHELVWVEGADHVTCIRRPEYLAALEAFLADPPAPEPVVAAEPAAEEEHARDAAA